MPCPFLVVCRIWKGSLTQGLDPSIAVSVNNILTRAFSLSLSISGIATPLLHGGTRGMGARIGIVGVRIG